MVISSLKDRVKARIPVGPLQIYRVLRSGDVVRMCRFLFKSDSRVKLSRRWTILKQMLRVSRNVTCYHTESELLAPISAMLSLSTENGGVIVEAGCFKGGSTAKLSLAAALAGRVLYVFDSFEGMPENQEPHDTNIWGGAVRFPAGSYKGAMEEVTNNVQQFGDIGVCRFVKGFFDQTLPAFQESIALAYLDVDLASSTLTCLRYLWPRLAPGGILFSQDGHLPLVLDVFNDDAFWARELGTPKPEIHGLGISKVIWCRKETA
jgi:O-methyltransferase